jgi:hypothetical protein
MLGPTPSFDESLLRWANTLVNGSHDRVGGGRRHDTIISVGDREWAGVLDEGSVFLRQEKEEAIIVPIGRVETLLEGTIDTEEDGSSDVN